MTATEQPLLKFMGTVTVPATTAPFIAREHFVENNARDAPIRIVCLEDEFERWFLCKKEPPFRGSILKYEKRTRMLFDWVRLDLRIFRMLGGEAKAETTLTELYAILRRQGRGQRGPLLTNGSANHFYIRDRGGILSLVNVTWFPDDGTNMWGCVVYPSGGWEIEIAEPGHLETWFPGDQAFYRIQRKPRKRL